MTFRDGKGREYTPRVNVQFLREYEARTGVKVFDVLLEFAGRAVKSGKDQGIDLKVEALSLLQGLCPTVDALFFALYRSSTPGTFDPEKFDDFCTSMGGDEFKALFDQMLASAEILKDAEALRAKIQQAGK